ncbi:MAG: HepT-like ribonuclease domain-containing protein [Acidimicrobiales bacterium]
MSEHDDLLYLSHIDDAISRVERTASRRGQAALEDDDTLRDATLFRLQTLAESTQRLSESFKDAHPEIPWERIAGFRNRVVHGYLDVRSDIVWAIVQHDLPELARCVREELALRNERDRPRDTGLGLDL